MEHTLRIDPGAADGSRGAQVRRGLRAPSTSVTPPAQDIRVNCINEPACHNQQKPADTEQLQTSSEESTELPDAPPGIIPWCQPRCFPQNPPGPARAPSAVGHRRCQGQAHLVPPSTHPPVGHSSREGSGLRCPSLLRSLDDPFQGWMAGGVCSYL